MTEITHVTRPAGDGSDAGDTLRHRVYEPGDEQSLVEMYSSIFRDRSTADWEWIYRNGPMGHADVVVLEDGDDVVGCISHLPVGVWVDGRRRRLAIGFDLMIRPEYRGRGGAKMLVDGFAASEHGFDLNLGSVNAASSHVTGRYLGTTTMGRAPLWRRIARVGAQRGPLVRPAAVVASAAHRAYGAVASWPSPSLTLVDLGDPGEEVDALAAESAEFARCVRIRDARYLRWRWLEQPNRTWRIRAARGPDGSLHGFVVFGAVGAVGPRRGMIGDLLARDYESTRALLLDAWRLLLADGCDSVICTYADPRPWARRAMLRSGFLPIRGRFVACGALSDRVGAEVRMLDSWYLTHGDVDI